MAVATGPWSEDLPEDKKGFWAHAEDTDDQVKMLPYSVKPIHSEYNREPFLGEW